MTYEEFGKKFVEVMLDTYPTFFSDMEAGAFGPRWTEKLRLFNRDHPGFAFTFTHGMHRWVLVFHCRKLVIKGDFNFNIYHTHGYGHSINEVAIYNWARRMKVSKYFVKTYPITHRGYQVFVQRRVDERVDQWSDGMTDSKKDLQIINHKINDLHYGNFGVDEKGKLQIFDYTF